MRRPDRITIEAWIVGAIMLASFAAMVVGWF
jgi:hypothetical protein